MTNSSDEKPTEAESTAIDEAESTVIDETQLAEAIEADDAEATDDADASDEPTAIPPTPRKQIDKAKVLAYGVIPALALILALTAGWLKFIDNSAIETKASRDESVQAARDSTITLLSYQPSTVRQQLTDARNLLTGEFRDSYTGLINDVVIPGAEQKQIAAVASVPRAASVSAGPTNAVVLVFVNQTVVVGGDAPTATASSVRVTMEKVDGKWLISKFDPV